MNDADVAVVGAGLAGLSAAGFLARAGKRVVVLERSDRPGGLARTIERGPYRFDLVSTIALGAELELRERILEHLSARCETLMIPDYFSVSFPGLSLRVPLELDGVLAAHADAFPAEREAFARFFGLCDTLLEAAHRLPLQLAAGAVDAAADRFPTLFRYRTKTLQEVLDELFADERAKALAGALWPLAGLRPSRLAFFTYAQGWAVHRRGMLRPLGGFSRLAEALAGGVEVAYGSEVTEVEAERPVVLACDPRPFLAGRVPAAHARRLERMRPSAPFAVLLVATAVEPVGAAHDNLVYDSWDPEGEPAPLWVSVPTLLDPSLAPAGEHVLVTRTTGAAGAEALLRRLEDRFPGTAAAATHVELLTTGPALGWEESVASAGSRRLAQRTPVRGLYLAGHWTQPGSGTYRAILSGMHAARALLADEGRPDAIPEFRAV